MNNKVIDEIDFDPLVMAVIPIKYGSKIFSKILKMDNEHIFPLRPLEVIKRSCQYYASSFNGRKEGTKKLIGVTHKPPIVIDPIQSIYVFPTASPNQLHCIWIAYDHVFDYYKDNNDNARTRVIFRNNQEIVVPISIHSFENQMLRTALLRTKIDQRSAPERWNKQKIIETSYRGAEAMEPYTPYEVNYDMSLLSMESFSKRLNK